MKYSKTIIGLSISAMASTALAGGFGVGTQSGSGTGNAFAGGAAVADDASVAWSNPAAMTLLPTGKQVTVAGHVIMPSFKFTNNGSTGAFAAAGTGEGGDGGVLAVIPNIFYTMDINPKLRFGFAVNVPFGLATEWDAGWRGKFTARESEIKTINLNPSLAYKVSDTVSIGGGVSMQKIVAKLSATTPGGAPVGDLTLDADDIGFGFNLGVLAQVTPSTRVGFTYRSKISYDLEGTATYSGTSGAAFYAQVRADLKVPDSASLSVFSTMGDKWEVMADLTHTGWSSIKSLDVIRTTSTIGGAPFGGAAGSTLTSLPFNWKDTLRVGVGANYKLNSQTKLRFGLAFDPTPTNDVDRTPRLPDQDRTWLAIGVQYKPSKQGVLEVGYAHEFVKDASVSVSPSPLILGRLNGTFNSKADILSVQYSHKF